MNVRSKTFVMAVALAAAACSLGSQAADSSSHQAAEDQWFARERALEPGNVTPVPFPPPKGDKGD